MLWVPHKILKRLIYALVEPAVDPLLSREQAGFRHRRSSADQATVLAQDIRDPSLVKQKGHRCLYRYCLESWPGLQSAPTSTNQAHGASSGALRIWQGGTIGGLGA